MRQKKLFQTFTISSGIILAAALLFKAPTANDKVINEMAQEISSNLEPEKTTLNSPPPRILASVNDPLSNTSSNAQLESYEIPEEHRTSLKDYISIHRKVFTDDSEKQRAQELMTDQHFIKGLERLLTAINPADLEFQILQDAAIDLLLESEAKFQSEAAREALMNIVKDSQIENKNLAKSDRENLAGIKAEVLYLWSSKNPKIADDIQKELPGSVSQSIWTNVQKTQNSNLKESLTEVTVLGN